MNSIKCPKCNQETPLRSSVSPDYLIVECINEVIKSDKWGIMGSEICGYKQFIKVEATSNATV